MKFANRFFFLSLFSAGIFSACTKDNPAPGNEVRPVEIPSNISEGTATFAFNFIHKLQETQPADDNLFVSPLSLHMALGMLVNGAESETADEILKTLKMEGVSVADLNNAYSTLIRDLPVADSKVSLGLANSMWYKSGFQVESNFQDILKKSFESDITGLPFDNAAKDKINQWASDKTNGKIKKVIEKIDADQVMFLLNALYFKGDWKTKFDAKATTDATFILENGSTRTVKMMNAKSDFMVARGNDYDALQLPYSNGQFKMTVLLPKGQHTVNKVLADIDAEKWRALTARMTEQGIKVGLPKFTLDYSVDLKKTLQEMGIRKAFTNGAELGKINKTADLFVSLVKQDAYLGIDEQGTEAAAVTTIGIGVTSAGPEEPKFICDRPYAIIISESTSNTILFAGRISNPEN